MEINTYFSAIPSLFSGILVTVELLILSLIGGMFLASMLTLCSYSKLKIIRILIYIYTFVIRGTPLLVQIFIIYYGASQFDFIRQSILWDGLLKHPLTDIGLAQFLADYAKGNQ